MSLHHHTAAQVRALRAEYPGFWIVEITTGNATCLAAIPPTNENAERPVSGLPGITGDMLHGASLRITRETAGA